MHPNSPDLLIAGAGIAGLTLAVAAARRGLKVVVVERREPGVAGAHWINGVRPDAAAACGMRLPERLVVHGHGRFVTTDPLDTVRVVVDPAPLHEMDMAAMLGWLIEEARQAGATVLHGVHIDTIDRLPGQTSHRVSTSAGAAWTAAVVADTRGHNPSNLEDSLDVCSAWQAIARVSDPGAARRWWEEKGLRPGDTWSLAGVEGGWSVRNFCLLDDGERLALLSGALHRPGWRSGARIGREALQGLPFSTQVERHGGGLIPLRPSPGPLVSDGRILAGDRAGLVFPLHGSGVSPAFSFAAIVAGQLSELLGKKEPTQAALWPIYSAWQRGQGATHAGYQGLRMLAATLTPEDHRTLLQSGISSPASVRAALLQEPLRPSRPHLAGLVATRWRLSGLLARAAQALAWGEALRVHHTRFPTTPDEFASWCATRDRLESALETVARRHLAHPGRASA